MKVPAITTLSPTLGLVSADLPTDREMSDKFLERRARQIAARSYRTGGDGLKSSAEALIIRQARKK